jgi:tRNA G18 (ribose-2'-O)-methylase SpoU
MGALANVHIMQESLFTAIKIAQQNAIRVIAVEVTGDKYYYEADLTGAAMIIIGGEDHPLSKPVTDRADEVVKIPMTGKINSLNMSVAASVVMFDKIRQENPQKDSAN